MEGAKEQMSTHGYESEPLSQPVLAALGATGLLAVFVMASRELRTPSMEVSKESLLALAESMKFLNLVFILFPYILILIYKHSFFFSVHQGVLLS